MENAHAPQAPPAVTLEPEQLLRDCELTFVRRSGPGGQHRNKVSSGVVIRHVPSGIQAEASERRSQAENRAVAIERLRFELALAEREDLTVWTEPLVLQHGGSRFRISHTNPGFAMVLADVLSRIHACSGEVQNAATFWQTSPSQIIRFLRGQPRALALVNQVRRSTGLHRLK